MWWNGPLWLRNPHIAGGKLFTNNYEQHNEQYYKTDMLAEKKVKSVVTTAVIGPSDLNMFNQYSSWKKLVHVVACILCFCNNALAKKRKLTVNKELLCVSEIQSSTVTLIKIVQKNVFTTDLCNLNDKNNDAKTSASIKGHLRTLNPFIDKHGLLRVGGRLLNASNITYEQRHQIILPHSEPFSSLFFRHEHERLMHAGPQAMLATMQLQYWPVE